jgi:hypothetical protein
MTTEGPRDARPFSPAETSGDDGSSWRKKQAAGKTCYCWLQTLGGRT